MNRVIRDELKSVLRARGFNEGLEAPNGSMVFDDKYLDDVSLGDLLETMVARREKIWGSSDVVGPEAMKKNYEDVVATIEAIKAVIEKMVLR